MEKILTTRLIRIGNSHGIRLPRVLAEKFSSDVDIEVFTDGDAVVLRPATHPRAGWAKQFAAMAAREDDTLLDADAVSTTKWDEEEWEWE
jgi:antitoxin MazE